MAITIKHTKVKLGADNKSYDNAMDTSAKKTKEFGGVVNRQFDNIKKKVAGALSGAAVGLFFKSATQKAITAQETFSRFGTIFENSFAKASAAAKNLEDNYGLSTLAAKDLLATTGDLLVGLGAQENTAIDLSEKTQKLAVDLASFNDLQGGAARASEILTKAMLGERDGLVALKIKISELDVQQRLAALGQDKLTGRALLLAKAQATMQLVTEQSGKAMGDYGRTSDSTANQIRNLGNVFENFQVSIGTAIIESESFQSAFQKIKDILEDPAIIQAVSSIGKTLINAFTLVIPPLTLAIKLISGVTNVLVDLKDVLIPLGIALAAAFAVAKIQAWASGFTILSASINTGNIALGAHIGLTKLAAAAQKALGAAMPLIALAAAAAAILKINSLLSNLSSQTDKEIKAERTHQDQLEINIDRLKSMRDGLGLTGKEMQQLRQKARDTYGDMADKGIEAAKVIQLIATGKAGADLKKRFEDWKKGGGELAKGFNDLQEKGKNLKPAVSDVGKGLKEIELAAIPVSDAFEKMRPKILTTQEEMEELHKKPMPGVNLELKKMDSGLDTTGKRFQIYAARTPSVAEKTRAFADALGQATDAVSSLGINLGGLGQALGMIGGGVASVGGLLNNFNNAAEGITGVFTKIGSVAGIATTAISVMGGIFKALSGPSGEMEAGRRRMQGMQMNTEGWGKKIEELAKSLGGADSAGRAFNSLLADMIRDSNITVGNFDTYVKKVREIFVAFDAGNATLAETQKNFGAAFSAMAAEADRLGISGGVAMTGLIMQAQEAGVHVQEIADYIENNMVNATKGWMKVLEQMEGVSVPILDEQARQLKMIESIPQGIKDQIEGATAALVGLSNTQRLLPEDFSQFGKVVDDVRAKLEAQGITGVDAAIAMKPLLERMIFLSNEYGFVIDDTTKALIDEGVAAGALSTDIRSDTQKQIDIQERMLGVLERLERGFFGVGDAADTMGRMAESAGKRITGSIAGWNKGLDDVARNINTSVIPSIDQMGRVHDDVMTGNSVIPDLEEWEKKNKDIKESIIKDIVPSINEINQNIKGLFDEMVSGAQVGTKAFHDLTSRAGDFGIEFDLKGFKKENIEKAFESFSKIRAIGEVDIRGIEEDIKKANKELKELTPGYDFSIKSDDIDKLQQKLSDAKSASKVFGDFSIKMFDRMYDFQKKVGENPALTDGIKDAATMLADFSKAQKLSEEEFRKFENIAIRAQKELQKQGFSANQQIQALGPLLTNLNALEQEYGYTISENTKEMIERGIKSGDVMADVRTDAERQIELQEKQLQVMKLMAQVMGVNLETLGDGSVAIATAPGDMGKENGEGTDKEKIDTFIFEKLKAEWTKNWENIAGDKNAIGAMIEKLSGLTVFDEAENELKDFTQWVRHVAEQMAQGLSWDPEKMGFFQYGTPGYIPLQTSIVGEAGPELLQFSDDKMNITPLSGATSMTGEMGTRTVSVEINVNAAEGLDPFRLSDTIKYIIENNTNGVVETLEQI